MDRFVHLAWIRDKETVYTGEAMALAVFLHAKAQRNSKELKNISKIFNDHNLDK